MNFRDLAAGAIVAGVLAVAGLFVANSDVPGDVADVITNTPAVACPAGWTTLETPGPLVADSTHGGILLLCEKDNLRMRLHDDGVWIEFNLLTGAEKILR